MFKLTENQIEHLVNRFLGWRLPENFNPDDGISFKRMFNEHTAHPMKHEPTGTNLFDATQATEMVRHILNGMPDHAPSIPRRIVQISTSYDQGGGELHGSTRWEPGTIITALCDDGSVWQRHAAYPWSRVEALPSSDVSS